MKAMVSYTQPASAHCRYCAVLQHCTVLLQPRTRKPHPSSSSVLLLQHPRQLFLFVRDAVVGVAAAPAAACIGTATTSTVAVAVTVAVARARSRQYAWFGRQHPFPAIHAPVHPHCTGPQLVGIAGRFLTLPVVAAWRGVEWSGVVGRRSARKRKCFCWCNCLGWKRCGWVINH